MASLRKTYLKDGTMISTIRREGEALALDNTLDLFLGRDSTMLYETMVFLADEYKSGRWKEADCVRYTNEADALAGHLTATQKWADERKSEVDATCEEYGGDALSTPTLQ